MPAEMHRGGDARVRARLPAGPTAPAAARRALGELAGAMPPEAMQDLLLLASEVVTNALRHAGGEHGAVALRATVEDGRCACSVFDSGPGFSPPASPLPRPDLSGGWGLYMVDTLSTRWGTRREAGLFCVWFELRW